MKQQNGTLTLDFEWLRRFYRQLIVLIVRSGELCKFCLNLLTVSLFTLLQSSKSQNAKLSTKPSNASFISITKRLYVACLDERHCRLMSRNVLNKNFLVVPLSAFKGWLNAESNEPDQDCTEFVSPCLEDVFKFHESVCSLERKNPRKKLVFQAGENQSVQTITGFLLGCHLLITHGIEYDRLCLTFRDFHDMFGDIGCDFADSISIHSCWRALWRAKCLKWIEFEKMTHTDPEKDYCIHIDEYIHYARCDFAFIGSLAMSTGI